MNTMHIKRTLCILILFSCLRANGQIKRAGQVNLNSTFSNALNAPSKRDAANNAIVSLNSGSAALATSTSSNLGNLMGNKQLNILYGVPTRVALDRDLLMNFVDERVAELLDLITYWQSMSESKKREIIKYYTSKMQYDSPELIKAINSQTVPDDVVNKIVAELQKQINSLETIRNEMYYNCPPVDFKSKKTTVQSEVRFVSPVTGGLGFMRATSGVVNLTNAFNNTSFDVVFKNPVSGTLIIYTK